MNKKKVMLMSAVALAVSANVAIAAKPAPKASDSSFIDGLEKSFSLTTNYVWRGVAQGQGAPAAQGGVTYNHDSGVSVDFWLSSSASNVASNEYDITVSYSGKAADMGYEAGVISYSYPQIDAGGFHEFFAGLKFNQVNAYVYIGEDAAGADNTYIELSADIKKFNIALGINSNDLVANDYNQITASVSLAKNLSLAVSQTDKDAGDNTELALTYTMAIK